MVLLTLFAVSSKSLLYKGRSKRSILHTASSRRAPIQHLYVVHSTNL
jgi:hypothetical protein